jgi:hypothetical protein
MGPYDMFYNGARELEAAEKSGDSLRIKALDFGAAPQASGRFHVVTTPLSNPSSSVSDA